MHDLGAKSDRSYAYYYSNVPEKVSEGFELFSQNDIVYIDLDNWSSLLYESVPLVVGDAAHLSALRRAGLFNRYDVDGLHKSFLDRSFMCIERTRRLASQKIALMTSDNSSVIINNSKNSSFGVPVLICVLDSKSALDSNIIDGYSSLLKFGPVGEELTPSAEDVIAYLDSIIEDPKFEFFLLEFIERLDSTRRARLLELLSR
jgi:hypothetical protein